MLSSRDTLFGFRWWLKEQNTSIKNPKVIWRIWIQDESGYRWIRYNYEYNEYKYKCAEQQWRGPPKPRSHPPTFLLGAGVSIRTGNRKPPSWPFMTNLSPESTHLMLHPTLWLKDFDSMQNLASCQTQLIIFRDALSDSRLIHWFNMFDHCYSDIFWVSCCAGSIDPVAARFNHRCRIQCRMAGACSRMLCLEPTLKYDGLPHNKQLGCAPFVFAQVITPPDCTWLLPRARCYPRGIEDNLLFPVGSTLATSWQRKDEVSQWP